jgi:hypothetical protein
MEAQPAVEVVVVQAQMEPTVAELLVELVAMV